LFIQSRELTGLGDGSTFSSLKLWHFEEDDGDDLERR